MKLRTAVLTAALGASVLTTVPATLGAASSAYACDNQTSTCDEDQPPDDPSYPGDPGDPGGGGGGEPGSPDNPIRLEDPVVVTGNYDPLPPTPPSPPPPDQYGPADPDGRRVVKEIDGADRTTRRASQCYRNDNSFPFTAALGISYTQGIEISATASASAASILSVEFGLQVNSSVTQTYNYSAVVPAGGTFAVYVSYQTNLYRVWTDSGPEEVVATVPVETSAGPC